MLKLIDWHIGLITYHFVIFYTYAFCHFCFSTLPSHFSTSFNILVPRALIVRTEVDFEHFFYVKQKLLGVLLYKAGELVEVGIWTHTHTQHTTHTYTNTLLACETGQTTVLNYCTVQMLYSAAGCCIYRFQFSLQYIV